jgi:hypothetical protein
LEPLPWTCTIIVVAAGALLSGCHSAASIINPSIALMERKRNEAPGSGCMSSGRPAGRGAASNSMLAATCAATASEVGAAAKLAAAAANSDRTISVLGGLRCDFIGDLPG